MRHPPTARHYVVSSLFLMAVGWGGLVLLIYVLQIPPLIWARWGFFVLWFTALSGTALPLVYFLNRRFPSIPPVEASTVVRQALWVGLYGSLLAWLQLGHVGTLWVWMGLAGGLMAVEYLLRLRERARWSPPSWKQGPDELADEGEPSDLTGNLRPHEPPE